jgi:succinate dehydrogenase/fumarate reductase flavoprotein subunit
MDMASETEAMDQYSAMLDNGIEGILLPDEVMVEIKRILWTYANVIRSEKTLDEALMLLAPIEASYNAAFAIKAGAVARDAVKARHCLKMARILLEVMKKRKESRGAHYRDDYPTMDNIHFNKRIFVKSNGTDISFDLL